MSLRAGYYGLKRKLINKIIDIPAIKTIGAGLSLQDGNLVVTGDLEDYAPNIIANTQLLKDTVGWSGKQLLTPNLQTGTIGSAVITNDNGVLNINGTGNASNMAIKPRTPSGDYTFYLPIGRYIFSAEGIEKNVYVGTTYNDAYSELASSLTDDHVEFEITANTPSDYKLPDGSVLIGLFLGIQAITYTNQKVYPMLRKAEILDSTYEPYRGTTAVGWDDYAKTGVHNKVDLYDYSIASSSVVVSDISNGGYKIKAANDTTQRPQLSYFGASNKQSNIKAGDVIKVKLNVTEVNSSTTARLLFRNASNSSVISYMDLSTTGEKEYIYNASVDTYISLAPRWEQATMSANDYIVFSEFMVLDAHDSYNGYTDYAMTNRELTDSAVEQKTAVNAIITAATDAADFAAFKAAMGAITPVTRSLSLTKDDITEEVKEEVKTVTKKRTTKKTEEE